MKQSVSLIVGLSLILSGCIIPEEFKEADSITAKNYKSIGVVKDIKMGCHSYYGCGDSSGDVGDRYTTITTSTHVITAPLWINTVVLNEELFSTEEAYNNTHLYTCYMQKSGADFCYPRGRLK